MNLSLKQLSPWIITIPLLLCAYATGLFFRGTDTIWFAPSILCLLCISLITLSFGFKAGWAIPKTPTFALILGFGLYLWLSTLWSTIPYNSILFAFIIGILPFFFITTILSPEPLKTARIYSGVLTIAACILAGWALIQYFFILKDSSNRIHHPMLNPNNLAVMLNMGLLPMLSIFFLVKSKRKMILAFVLALLLTGGLIVTQSRGAILSAILAFIVLIIVCDKIAHCHWKRMSFFIAGATLLYLFIDNFKFGLHNLQAATSGAAVDSMEGRHTLWLSTLQLIQDHPWLGTGLGSFYYYYPAYRLPSDKTDGFFVHMDPLQFWQEMGIAAPILFYAVLIAILIRTVQAFKATTKDDTLRLEIMGSFCALFALILHTHITFHLYILITLIPAAILLAWWYGATEKALKDKRTCFKPMGKKRTALITALILLHGLAALWITQAGAGLYLLNKASPLMAKGKLEEGYAYVKKARLLSPRSYGKTFEYEAKYRYALLQDYKTPKTAAERQELYAQAHEYLDEAIKRNPVLSHLWNLKALLYYIGRNDLEPGGEQKAIQTLERTLAYNPLFTDARIGLAKIYQTRGDFKKALFVLEDGLKWPTPRNRSTLNYYTMIAQIRLKLGDKAGHDEIIQAAIRFAKRYGLTTASQK